MQSAYQMIIASPVGQIGIACTPHEVKKIAILADHHDEISSDHPLANQVARAFDAYFERQQYRFNFNLGFCGTAFQKKVWQALQQIPLGQAVSYGEIARALKTSPRAIGQACRTNPFLIIVPCHRVIAQTHIGGFSGQQTGAWIKTKAWLLKHEGLSFNIKQ